jgi:MYXO-CTERM domain-containing protein
VAGQNYVVVFDSISSASGNPSFGNLLGDVRFGDGVYESGSGITELTPQSFSTSYLSEPIPEPGTWAAAALLVGGAAFMRWRRRQTA